ncbi:hypothetical protein ABT354_37660 [Streptomyces sp. NPDC000594]
MAAPPGFIEAVDVAGVRRGLYWCSFGTGRTSRPTGEPPIRPHHTDIKE